MSILNGIKINADTTKQRNPLNVWTAIAMTASITETTKAIQRKILFSIIGFTSTVRAYATIW